jgi:hypothetical protein
VSCLLERYKDIEGIDVVEGDARHLDRYPDGAFNIIFDKGLVDALFTAYEAYKEVQSDSLHSTPPKSTSHATQRHAIPRDAR